MKKHLNLIAMGMALLSCRAGAQDAFGFFTGDVFPPARSTPAAWLLELHKADGLLNSNIAVAEFLPNTKLAWHNHPGGQILLITDGVGYYQEKGKAKQIVRKGDVIQCAPGVEHWHGASVESGVTYLATSPAQKGGTVWAQAVTDEEYKSAAVDRRSAPAGRKKGPATLAELTKADSIFPFSMASATFAAGEKLDWHKDPAGQVLVITEGTGYYQERGKPKQIVRKGDVIKSSPGVEHWHGASAEMGVTHIAITPVGEGGTVWLQKVTEKEYAE
jgi:quercetin dioxygenase-like cupin family protein